MITNNFITFMKTILCASENAMTYNLPVRRLNGDTIYLNFNHRYGFPYSMQTGVQIGSGTTPATPADYSLQSRITSGSGVTTSIQKNYVVDNNGDTSLEIIITINNTTSSPVTIGELGYAQALPGYTSVGSASSSSYECLLDRTVLSNPVTIEAGDYETIKYTLKTSLPS